VDRTQAAVVLLDGTIDERAELKADPPSRTVRLRIGDRT
jgi:hypothetical protein